MNTADRVVLEKAKKLLNSRLKEDLIKMALDTSMPEGHTAMGEMIEDIILNGLYHKPLTKMKKIELIDFLFEYLDPEFIIESTQED
jgi:hypothetical protein